MASVLRWSQKGVNDLRAAYDYIARDSARYAQQFVQGVLAACERAATFPAMGRSVPEHSDPSIREVYHGSYRIVYRMVEDGIIVAAIVHGARRPDDQLDDTMS